MPEPQTLPHDACAELLPWYVNGTLASDERQAVGAHLEDCPDCREELTLVESLEGVVQEQELPEELGDLDVILERIGPAKLLPFRTPSPVRWVILAQAAAIIALVAALIWAPGPEPQTYETLSDSPTARIEQGVQITVAFQASATEAEMRALLLELGAEIAAGPNTAGAYVLRFGSAEEPARSEALVRRLRADPLVRLAEPTAGSRP